MTLAALIPAAVQPLHLLLAAEDAASGAIVDGPGWAGWILWLPLLSLVLCGACWAMRVRSKLPAWITVGCLGASFLVTLSLYLNVHTATAHIHLFDWFDLHWRNSRNREASFVANFAMYVD